jgi:hypothetical protein
MVVGVFDSVADAYRARDALLDSGVSDAHVQVRHARTSGIGATGVPGSTHEEASHASYERSNTVSGVIGDMFKSLFVEFGGKSDDEALYDEVVRRGSAVLTARASDDAAAERVVAVMQREGSIDVHGRSEQWRKEGWTGSKADTPLSEMQLDTERRVKDAATRDVSVLGVAPADGAVQTPHGVRVFRREVP